MYKLYRLHLAPPVATRECEGCVAKLRGRGQRMILLVEVGISGKDNAVARGCSRDETVDVGLHGIAGRMELGY